jgi:hypothetical protein
MLYLKHKSWRTQREAIFAPLINGHILFFQVSRQTNTAVPEASRKSRRKEVRAKNLRVEEQT